MGKIATNKIQYKKLKKVTKFNLKDFIGDYKNILPVGFFALMLTVFVSINLQLVPSIDELPQTGEPSSEVAVNTFVQNAENFIKSPQGMIFLIVFFASLVTFLVFMAKSGFPRSKK
jgi:hypothetical protein